MDKVLHSAKPLLTILLPLMALSGCAGLLDGFFRSSDRPPVASPAGRATDRPQGPSETGPGKVEGVKPAPVKPAIPVSPAATPGRPDDLLHVLKPGETISDLAKIYFGDPLKFDVIAQHNKLTNCNRVYAGQVIRIPRSEALRMAPPMVEPRGPGTPEVPPLEPQSREAETGSLPTQDVPGTFTDEANTRRSRGIALYEMGRFDEALPQFEKALSLNPGDRLSAELWCKIHLQKAKSLQEEADYLGAADHFRACLRHAPDCQDCRSQAETSEGLYKEAHYKRGMQLFHEQRLNEAVEAWERVRAVDPQYKRVDSLIQKGRLMIKRMEEIRERQT